MEQRACDGWTGGRGESVCLAALASTSLSWKCEYCISQKREEGVLKAAVGSRAGGFVELQGAPGSSRGLQGVVGTRGNSRGLQGATGGFRAMQGEAGRGASEGEDEDEVTSKT